MSQDWNFDPIDEDFCETCGNPHDPKEECIYDNFGDEPDDYIE